MISENEFRKAPVYLQIREAIYNKIISGEYKAGEKTSCRGKTGGRIRGQQNDGEQGTYGIGK